MFCRIFQLIVSCALVVGSVARAQGQATVTIDPEKQTGATVRHFGWDAKLSANVASSPKAAQRLFGDCPANLLRVPIRPHLSTPDGKVILANGKQSYKPLIKSIKMARQVNPDVKVFASTKLMGADTFPAWLQSNRDGKIFNANVKCPQPAKYAEVVKNYFELMASEGIKIDFLGLNNEVGGALTPEIYVATAKILVRKLEQSKIADVYKEFKWVGCEEFGVPGSLRYAQDLLKLNAADYVNLVGSHFYPDHESGSIESWDKLSSLGVPSWHTEVHVRSSDEPRKNILALRDGMSIVFKINQVGCQGYVWWAGSANQSVLTNQIRHKMIESMLYGNCVLTSGSYEGKGNPPGKAVVQATRVGDTVWLWCFNPGQSVEKLPVKLVTGAVESCEARCWTGGAKIGPESESELKVDRVDPKQVVINQVPALSITLLEIRLEDDQILLPLQKWQFVKPRRREIEASLSTVSDDALVFKSKRGKTIRASMNDLSPIHQDEILDALKAHKLR